MGNINIRKSEIDIHKSEIDIHNHNNKMLEI